MSSTEALRSVFSVGGVGARIVSPIGRLFDGAFGSGVCFGVEECSLLWIIPIARFSLENCRLIGKDLLLGSSCLDLVDCPGIGAVELRTLRKVAESMPGHKQRDNPSYNT